jgi:hypothetical protein
MNTAKLIGTKLPPQQEKAICSQIELLWKGQLDPWKLPGRASVRISGRVLGEIKGMADAEADEVIEDQDELKRFAFQEFDKWWEERKSAFSSEYGVWPIETIKPDMNELKRVFRTGFIEGYNRKVESVRRAAKKSSLQSRDGLPNPWSQQWEDEEDPETQRGVSINIQNDRQLSDGVTYTVNFFDPSRMTQPVSFGISVKDDGLVELEELG